MKMIINTTQFAVVAVILVLLSDIVNVAVGDAQISALPLYESTATHCDEMILLHRWEGSCCSLNVTEGEGCVLNVMDGYCKVRGQVWMLDYNSTFDTKPCPASEYSPDDLGIKPIIKKGTPLGMEGDSSGGATTTTTTTTTLIAAVAVVAGLFI